MNLIEDLKRLSVETGSLACLGCGYEHNCGIQGCAIIRAGVDKITELESKLTASQQRERAAVDAINRMAEYIVTKGRVDYWLCDDIPEELHLKHQPQNDGNYANAPCIKCVAEYFMGGPQEAGEEQG